MEPRDTLEYIQRVVELKVLSYTSTQHVMLFRCAFRADDEVNQEDPTKETAKETTK